MELVNTMEINGEEREIADAYARGKIEGINNNLMDLKMLGWSVPKECPIQNEVNGNQFVQKVGRVALNSLGWSYVSAHNLFFANVNDNKEKYSMNFVITKSGYSKVKVYYTIAPDKSCGFIVDTVRQFAIKDSAYTDLSSFVAAMKGEYLYYELATPITRTIGGNEAVTQIKSDLSKQCKKDDITTNETLIGTFNGKNYYRKLFTGIGASGSSITVNVGEKIEIYKYYGRAYTYGQSGASDVKYPIPNKNYYIDSQNASETSFQLTIPTSSDTRKIDLVIEYTKVDE